MEATQCDCDARAPKDAYNLNYIHHIHDATSTLLGGGERPATTLAPDSTLPYTTQAWLASPRATAARAASRPASPFKKTYGKESIRVGLREWQQASAAA